MAKTLIYQIFTRLYGNINPTRKHDGTIEENGCGKFNDINDAALEDIAKMGYTHVWFTGIIRHASATDYSFITRKANANVVKGRAGSPYAICDYYDVDPDLAENVNMRLEEFRALVERSHKHGLKVIIDFVPNHVARNYHSDVRPAPQIGGDDDTTKAFSPMNNFYYFPGEDFTAPVNDRAEAYHESPARASGNDAFTTAPSINDWYETVKLNYGVDYLNGRRTFFSPYPDTWYKMRDILHYWADFNIDGFRVDMAEMVPVEFWRWCIRQVTARHPKIMFIAETYDPSQYGEYIAAGFNLLYDKVVFYDTLRAVMKGEQPASNISSIWHKTGYCNRNMLYFLENHDEQRIASDPFLGGIERSKPGAMLMMLMGKGGSMVYFGQELGERGMDAEGFSGCDGKTTIFDYWGIELLQKMVGNHTYDGAKLPAEAKQLKEWYSKLMNIVQKHDALAHGDMYDLMWNQGIFVDATKLYAFLRHNGQERFLVLLNFSAEPQHTYIRIGDDAWKLMGSTWNECILPLDMMTKETHQEWRSSVDIIKDRGLELEVGAYDGKIFKI